MRCFRNTMTALASVILVGSLAGVTLRYWSDDSVAGSKVERALFKVMDLPGGAVLARRPPVEATAQVGELIKQTPSSGDLYAIRAEEEERNLQIDAAESDWRRAAELSVDRAAGLIDLADFYQRRLESIKEVSALVDAGKLVSSGMDRYRADSLQAPWSAFERAVSVYNSERLAPAIQDEIFEAWIARYPKAREPMSLYLDALLQSKNKDRAQELVNQIAARFANESQFRLQAEAKLASIGGGVDAELGVYSKQFSVLWPPQLRSYYYDLLSKAHQLRSFLNEARGASIASPSALEPVLRLFFYYEQSGKREAANGELLTWRQRVDGSHTSINANDLRTIAALFERAGDYNEAARASYELYEIPSGTQPDKEQALGSLIDLLLDVPEQPLHLGERDLSLYRNVAELDHHPGFLNGILSLALNTTFPQYEYQNASQSALTYFHRAAASQFLETFRNQFPDSDQTALLEAKLFAAYATYGQDEAVIRFVPSWLSRNSDSPAYVNSALLLGDAYSHTRRSAEEFALYDKLLAVLADKSDHVPLGPEFVISGQQVNRPQARSADYSRVLDRYISRLTQANRIPDAIALYEKEINRNPDDPGLYQHLALFVEQNHLDSQLATTYQAAFNRFKDDSWASKLARLYLRRKQYSDYETLARQVIGRFEGSELSKAIGGIEPNARLNPELYRQVNLYAHRRFPHNLIFVRNLLTAYQTGATVDRTAYEKLLRENWFYDSNLRTTFFEYLSRTGELEKELAALPAIEAAARQGNPAAIQMKAEGSAWLTDFESSSGAFIRLAEIAPGDRVWNTRAISVERSLASSTAGDFEQAVALAEQDVKAAPGDSAAVIRVGEIYADRELYGRAAPWWNRVSTIHPGSTNGYLEGATVFWDYYQYNDALELIDAARTSFHQAALFAYEAGAICENQNHFARAIDEYVKAALEQPATGQNGLAENRLITLARRKDTALIVEKRTDEISAGVFNGPALQLRIAILENQGRRDDIHKLLGDELARATSLGDLDEIRQSAEHFGFDDTASQALARVIAFTTDPVEKIKARVDLALYKEGHHDSAGAERDLAALLNVNSDVLGVIRADVDFLWRQKDYGKAVAVLTSAAARAVQPFQAELRREAAQRAADSGEFEASRHLLDQLLAADPYNGDLLAQKAATYARARDNSGLTHFYSDELKALDNSNLPAQERANRSAALRRGFIPALVATKQFDGALGQYEQLLNQFPEDESLAREAARFSNGHQLGSRLVSYYDKATADSPHNYRWPLLLARVDAALGQYSAAIAAYEKAAYIRPDRSDFLIAKADLETRLLRFKDAIKTNQKLYDLSYHDTRYLAEQASLYARLQNTSEAVRLLRAAYVDTNPKDASGYISMLNQFIAWHLFAEVDAAYKELRPLIQSGNDYSAEAVALEAQALASIHHPEAAIQVVREAWQRVKSLRAGGDASRFSDAIGSAAKEYLTPAEKTALAKKLELTIQPSSPIDTYELANSAGLLDVAADVLVKRLADANGYSWNTLQQLQTSRLEYEPLGRELETLARSAREETRREPLLQAAVEAYSKAGDNAAQLRIASFLRGNNRVMAPARYAQLFVHMPGDFAARFSELAKQNPSYADAVVQYLLSNGPEHERAGGAPGTGANLPAPWTQSYSALAGLYLLSSEPWVGASFDSILGPHTVGAELAQLGAQEKAVLRGELWFYYAARYGDYLNYREQDGNDLLPAYLEAAPEASKSYVDLGDTYFEAKQLARSLSLYQEALQLSPERADVYDRVAVAQASAGKIEDAIDTWRSSLRILTARVEQGPLPPDYWHTARDLFIHANRFRVLERLHPGADAMLRAYTKRNAGYNFSPFVEGILENAPDQARALGWTLELARELNVPNAIEELVNSKWIPEAQKDSVYRFLIEHTKSQLSGLSGDAATAAAEQLQRSQINYVNYLLEQNRPQEAWQILQDIQPRDSRPPALQLKIAALTGRLDEQLAVYRSQPETAPTGDQILVVAAELGTVHPELALTLKEFEYQRELDTGSTPAPAYFGLAQVRIAQKRFDDAKSLIRTVTVSVGAPFENLPEAVNVLEKAGMISEASGYAAEWCKAEPWNAEAQLRSTQLKQDAVGLDAIRRSVAAPYAVRAEAAIGMRLLKRSADGRDELALLTHNAITPQEASQSFFVFARLYASQTASNGDRIALLRRAIALDPAIQGERLDLAAAAFGEQLIPLALAALESYSSGPANSSTRTELLRQVREEAAAALVSQKEFSRAIPLYDQVLAALPPGTERMRVMKLRDGAQAANSLAALNSSRQPLITEALTQPSMVKPRLTTLPAEGAEQ